MDTWYLENYSTREGLSLQWGDIQWVGEEVPYDPKLDAAENVLQFYQSANIVPGLKAMVPNETSNSDWPKSMLGCGDVLSMMCVGFEGLCEFVIL